MYRTFKFRGYLRDPRFESRIYKISNGFLKTLYSTVSFIAGLNLNWLGSVRQATDGWIIKMDRPRLLPPFSPRRSLRRRKSSEEKKHCVQVNVRPNCRLEKMRSALASSRRVRKRCATQQCDFKLPWVTLNDTVFFFFFLSFLYLFLTSLTNNDQTGDPLTLHDFSRILLLLFFFVHQGFFVPRIDLRHTRSFSESRERCFSFAQVELFFK